MIKQINQELEDEPGLEKIRESCAVFLLINTKSVWGLTMLLREMPLY